MKFFMETLQGIRYKLRMMGVPIYGPLYIYGDNMLVIHITQRHESTLKKIVIIFDITPSVSMLQWVIP